MQVFDRYDPLDDMFSLNGLSPMPQLIKLYTYRLKLWFWLWIVVPKFHIDSHQVHVGSSHPCYQLSQPKDESVTHPGSLTNTGETSSTSALPSPAFPLPYPVSSCSSLRAVVLHIRP
jgi:hypothetical protein